MSRLSLTLVNVVWSKNKNNHISHQPWKEHQVFMQRPVTVVGGPVHLTSNHVQQSSCTVSVTHCLTKVVLRNKLKIAEVTLFTDFWTVFSCSLLPALQLSPHASSHLLHLQLYLLTTSAYHWLCEEARCSHLDGWVITNSHAHVSVSLAGDVFLCHIHAGQRDADPGTRAEQQEDWVHTLVIILQKEWLKCYSSLHYRGQNDSRGEHEPKSSSWFEE